MRILVNTGVLSRDSIIRGRLNELGYEAVQIHHNDFETQSNGMPIGLYIHDQPVHVSLLKKIRLGQSNINPFAPVTIISNDPPLFLSGVVGVSVVCTQTFTVNSIDDAISIMVEPKDEFIIIPKVYVGPERRKGGQFRPDDRRMGLHKDERRFCPIKSESGLIDWKPTASGRELQQRLNEFRTELMKATDKRSCVVRLVETLKAWNFTTERIVDVTGMRV